MTKKSPEYEILAKGNNSCKSRSNATKVKLDLYYVKTNPYTKFQVNISKDDLEKFGKTEWTDTEWTDGLTDGQTDGEETYSPPPPPPPPRFHRGRGLITPVEVGQAWRKSNLICILSWQIHILNFKSISQKTAEKSLENWSVTDGQTDWQTDWQTDSEQTKSPPGRKLKTHWPFSVFSLNCIEFYFPQRVSTLGNFDSQW